MNTSKSKRLISAILCAVMITSALPLSSAAAGSTSNSTFKRTLDDVKELLDTVSYEEYLANHAQDASATKSVTIDATAYDKEATTDTGASVETYDGVKALYTSDEGKVVWPVSVSQDGMYEIELEYYPVEGKATSIERALYIDGKVPYSEARSLSMTKVWVDTYAGDFGVFATDVNGNDIRPTKVEQPEWRTYTLTNSTGYYVDNFQFYFSSGDHTLTLESVREPVAIKSITLKPITVHPTYEEYLAEHSGSATPAIDTIKIDAENPQATSEQVIYPIYDRSSPITDPQDASLIKLNTIGSDKWQTVGQWVRYEVEVPEDGMYNIGIRFRQEILTGMFTSRRVLINGEVPFEEASYLQFNYSDAWQSSLLNDGTTEFQFYLKAGKNTIEFEVVLGHLAAILNKVSASLDVLNAAYLKILMITGTSPDQYRDYNFGRLIPDTIISMANEAKNLGAIAEELKEITGGTGQHVATLNTVSQLVERMAGDEDEVAKNLTNFKSYLGTLGTWLYDSQKQNLEMDYITVQSVGEKAPKAAAAFYEAAWFEVKSFVLSFFSDYNTIGATSDQTSSDTVTLWYTEGRDQAQILRQMIDYEFTPTSNVSVSLKLVAAGSLLPSILAGVGPDVTFLGSADTINYAIRSAVLPLNEYEGFEDVTQRFSPSAMVPLTLYGTTYGLPSTQAFYMMFYRMDIFAELGLELPETWEDMYSLLPILQNNHMEIAFPSKLEGTKLVLYQMGGDLYADEGKRINLDSNVGLTAFSTLTDLFSQYKFPLTYDFPTRFRNGEMPLGIMTYTTYNTLIVYASEIRDVWEMVPLLGWENEDGSVNNASVSTVSAVVMPRGAQNTDKAWELMKWFTDSSAQARYANELVAVMGPAAKYNTANIAALAELPWTASEYKALEAQMYNLAAVPEYPGGYIIDRYVNFAFLNVYNSNADPVESMLDNITEINKEISRKRKEFNLEYYDISYSTSFVESAS